MNEFTDTPLSKLRLLAVGIYIIASLLLLSFVIAVIWKIPSALAQESRTKTDANIMRASREEGQIALTNGMLSALDGVSRVTDSGGQAFNDSLRSVSKSTATAAAQGGRFAVQGVGSGVSLIADGMGTGLKFVAGGVGGTFSFIANVTPVGDVIRPGDETPVPVIDADAPLHAAIKSELSTVNAASQKQDDSDALWPINGEITAGFGVPHWPYQPTHTGIDITDREHSGTTPIKPFRSGRVIETIVSNYGFGNHVIIDHGGGVTSLYGHLYPSSISVEVGQEVNQSTILGYEGSTGASTGTHLHFEIRLNGQPVDPRLYVSGQP